MRAFPRFTFRDGARMRLLALDVGERRIGLASGVAELGTALPAGVLRRTRLAFDLRSVLDAARDRQADAIVVGVPYRPRGEDSPQTKQILGFIRALRKETSLPVHIVDEAFTSLWKPKGFCGMRDCNLRATAAPWTKRPQCSYCGASWSPIFSPFSLRERAKGRLPSTLSYR